MLARFDPFRSVDSLFRPIAGAGMAMDVYRRGDEFVVELDVPGVDEDSIDVTVENDVLQITAERQAPFAEDDRVLVAERTYGTWTRHVHVGRGLDTANVQASYRNGVLRLVIPVAEEAKPHKIRIGAGNGNTQLEASATA